jgi:hypothetical protein
MAARAQDDSAAPADYQPEYGQGFATSAELDQAVGALTFSLTACKNSEFGSGDRSVRVTSTKSDYDTPRVIDAILLRAAQYAWQACPLYFIFGMGQEMPALRRDISSIDLYLPDGTRAFTAFPLIGDQAFNNGPSYKWGNFSDLGPQERAAAAAATAQAAQAVQQQAIAQQNERNAAQTAADVGSFFSTIWLLIKLAFWGGIAAWLFSKREIIARWYYSLTPHPATAMVEAAIERGVELDGQAFADLMRPMPGGAIEKQVRAEQARKLTGRAQAHADRLRTEADQIRDEARREKEFITAQDDLAKAAVAHERAKARLDALRKRVG